MRKILLIWDVKSRGTPATSFYRELRGYDYKTKSGKCHTDGVLDELPEDVWDFVSRSALIVEKNHVKKIEKVFKKYGTHLEWVKYEVREKK
ncbi:hypothetical protein AKJ48_00910 [candidate division MSBL1 archaeon SCGC-AAA261O19]|uniref:Uncharacterized protein n=2 Tax=candidate division MSBL1 TaxID=215777 RepID=A0A133V1T5_9EURY|nr:hypothetical protein AKJ42_00890 [candidate division MSBL1 archaeon SCGC-AAA261C02]KXB04923.1 hypothetical protein AKJ48_00910 [candidate division MSBL1 archaeon SCGC-AAA261O19]